MWEQVNEDSIHLAQWIERNHKWNVSPKSSFQYQYLLIQHSMTSIKFHIKLHSHNFTRTQYWLKYIQNISSSTSFSPHPHIPQSFHCVTLARAVRQRWRFRKARSLPPWWPGKPTTKHRKRDQKRRTYTLPTKMVLHSTVNYKKQHFWNPVWKVPVSCFSRESASRIKFTLLAQLIWKFRSSVVAKS